MSETLTLSATYTPCWTTVRDGKSHTERGLVCLTYKGALVELTNSSEQVVGKKVPLYRLEENVEDEEPIFETTWVPSVEYNGQQAWILTRTVISAYPISVDTKTKAYSSAEAGKAALEKKLTRLVEEMGEFEECNGRNLLGYKREFDDGLITLYLEQVVLG